MSKGKKGNANKSVKLSECQMLSTDSEGCKYNRSKMAVKSVMTLWIILSPRQIRTDHLVLNRIIKQVQFHSLVKNYLRMYFPLHL